MGLPRALFRLLGSLAIGILLLVGAGLVWFRLLDKGKYATPCEYSLACRSMYCLHHALRGEVQVTAPGTCTMACAADTECGDGLRCVALTEASLDDLPPVRRPARACIRVETPAPTR
jgi:hypothetical protein